MQYRFAVIYGPPCKSYSVSVSSIGAAIQPDILTVDWLRGKRSANVLQRYDQEQSVDINHIDHIGQWSISYSNYNWKSKVDIMRFS